ncbi:two-pore potassium channel 1-like [Bidens hawaiensis]|uniref:two-pore potassium channel 1-like n=1 Tax=Bidens hawaiensis TaxID=980011 RepID=UPI0040492F52
MTTTNERKASPKHLNITDQTASIKRRSRFRRIKSAPLADSLSCHNKHPDPIKPTPKSMFDHFYPNYLKVALMLFAYLAAGTICFHLTRHQIKGSKTNSVLDALYFTIVTMSSVGYGDLVPDSTLTILLACLFVVLGMLIVGLVLSKAAELLVEKQEQLLVKALHLHETIGEKEILQKIKTKRARNKFIILVVLLLVLMAGGMAMLLWVENLDFLNAFSCVMGTLTGTEYVDKCFSTQGGRAFDLVWILATIVFLAQLLFTFVTVYTERKQKLFVKQILKRKTTTSDLEAADFDGDGIVVAAEFVVYKSKEMGKISEDDITPIMDEFETLDFDKTGTLSQSDLLFSQSFLSVSDLMPPRLSV